MTNIDGYRWVWSNVAEVDQLIVKGAVYLGNTVTGEYTVLDLVYEWSTHSLGQCVNVCLEHSFIPGKLC